MQFINLGDLNYVTLHVGVEIMTSQLLDVQFGIECQPIAPTFRGEAAKGGDLGAQFPCENAGGCRGGAAPLTNCESDHNCESEPTAKANMIEIAT